MTDTAEERSLPASRTAAVERVGSWLCSELGGTAVEIQSFGDARLGEFTHCWRLPPLDEPVGATLSVYLDHRFPRSTPRVRWENPPDFPSIPHVEPDGFICALSAIDIIEPSHPLGLVQTVLKNAAELIELGTSGANIEDFQTEFLSYWNPIAPGRPVTSLLDPSGPSRRIAVWRGRLQTVVAENSSDLRLWLARRAGKDSVSKLKIETGALLWVGEPLLPCDYPSNVRDLLSLAARPGVAATEIVQNELGRSQNELTFVLGGAKNEGISFGAASITTRIGRGHPGSLPGFRPGNAPAQLLAASRTGLQVQRAPVERADPFWIHGRDHNPDLIELVPAKVTMIGCGSLGSLVAELLAQAGVGNLQLIDPQDLQWPNIARHALGAASMHRNKASSLAQRLQRDFPSSLMVSHDMTWQCLAERDPDQLFGADLIISTLGSWSDEAELNDLFIAEAISTPTLFSWSEPRGVAGHAILTGQGTGCLACGVGEFGEAYIKVVKFDEETLLPEPACGEHFQPYGASQIAMIATLATDLALEHLTGRKMLGRHRMLAAQERIVSSAGGKFAGSWISLSDGRSRGGNIEEREWEIDPNCRACGGKGRSC